MDTVERGAMHAATAHETEKESTLLTARDEVTTDTSSTKQSPSLRDLEAGIVTDEKKSTQHGVLPKPLRGSGADNGQPAKDIPPLRGLSFLDRFLVIWILLAMAIGIILGNCVPDNAVGEALEASSFVGVSVPIAIGLLVMMYPILCKVRYETLHLVLQSRQIWIQLAFSFVVNWILAPLLMTGLAWAFLPDREDLRQGLIFVGIARCIAMVLIWTDLAGGDNDYCAVLVAFNSILQMILFAPLAVFYIKVVSDEDSVHDLEYALVARSVAVFLGIPLAAAIVTRFSLRSALGEENYQRYFIRIIGACCPPLLSPCHLCKNTKD